MKRIISIIIISSLVINIILFITILNNNNKIKSLQYTDQQILDVFQVTSELEQNLYKYELDTSIGTYYYQVIAKTSWLLAYIEYNIQYESSDDPIFELNLALNNLFGLMITEQGKVEVMSHSSEIRALLHEIGSAHRESRVSDRNQSILEFKEYLTHNVVIYESPLPNVYNEDPLPDVYNEDNNVNVPEVKHPKIIIPKQ